MSERELLVQRLGRDHFDVLVIGGGINGAVAAAALAGRGVRVALIDRDDFAAHTSSNSSNLIWGGIKYLESHEYGLVNALCLARNRLRRHFPSKVQEIRFLATVARGFRFPPQLLYLGAWLYWLIGRCQTRAPRYLSASKIKALETVIDTRAAAGGLEYSDCFLQDNDARFVFDFVRSAIDSGCAAANYVQALGSRSTADGWRTDARDRASGATFTIRATAVINACGPSVDDYNRHTEQHTAHHHLFSKGAHLIVRRLSPHKKILAFFANDGRLFFVMPMANRTCIGTTDTRVASPEARVSDQDRQFILANANAHLDLDPPLSEADIIAERCGVRPLAVTGDSAANTQDFLRLSRKHAIEVDAARRCLSIFGGKLTDCINVGEEICGAVAQLGVAIPAPKKIWFGEGDRACRERFFARAREMAVDQLTPAYALEPLSQRLWRRYGEAANALIEQLHSAPQLAQPLIKDCEYLRVELQHAAAREMIVTLEDFLRRRSKLSLVVRHEDLLADTGLREACAYLFGEQQAEQKLAEYCAQRDASRA